MNHVIYNYGKLFSSHHYYVRMFSLPPHCPEERKLKREKYTFNIWLITPRPSTRTLHLDHEMYNFIRFFTFVYVFLQFRNYLSLEKNWPFIWINLNPLHPKILCAKFCWNWPSGFGEEDFKNLSMYFCNFVIISPWKRAEPFIWTPFTLGWFVPSLVEIGPVVLEKKVKMWKVYRRTDRQTDDGRLVIRIAHLSFQLRWAKNNNCID